MQRILIFLIIIFTISPISSAQEPNFIEVEFNSPTHLWGNPTLAAPESNALMMLSPNGTIRVYVETGAEVIETKYQQATHSVAPSIAGQSETVPIENHYTIDEPGWIELVPVDGRILTTYTSLPSISLSKIDDIYGTPWNENQRYWHDAEHGSEFLGWHRLIVPWPDEGVLWSTSSPQSLSFTAESPSQISWANAEVRCIVASPCPSSDSESYQNSDEVGPLDISTKVNVQINKPKVVHFLTNETHFHTLSKSWSISGNMAARLPQASGQDCEAIGCDGEKTIRLDGDFTINNLQKAGDDRFSASIQGDIQNLILDEQPMDPSLLWAIGAGTATVTALAWVLLSKLGLMGLFTRISAEEALEHPRREVLYEYITQNPGTTFREIVRNTGIPTGTTRHHLNVLRRCDLVVEKPHRSTLRFFENHGKFDASWDTVVMLREEPLREVHAWLSEHPESPQKIIVAAMAERGHSRGTTQHRLKRLQDAYLVTYRQQGRLKLYTAHKEPQYPQPVRTDVWNGLDASWPHPRP